MEYHFMEKEKPWKNLWKNLSKSSKLHPVVQKILRGFSKVKFVNGYVKFMCSRNIQVDKTVKMLNLKNIVLSENCLFNKNPFYFKRGNVICLYNCNLSNAAVIVENKHWICTQQIKESRNHLILLHHYYLTVIIQWESKKIIVNIAHDSRFQVFHRKPFS